MKPWETVSLIPSGLENSFKTLTIKYKVHNTDKSTYKVNADN